MTYGEKAVGLTFNPSGNDDVTTIKKLYAQIIDICAAHHDVMARGEKARLFSVAITEAQTAQMCAELAYGLHRQGGLCRRLGGPRVCGACAKDVRPEESGARYDASADALEAAGRDEGVREPVRAGKYIQAHHAPRPGKSGQGG